jgi:ferredoxin
VRIVVDRDLCEANGVCVSIAPAVFELEMDDTLRILDPTPSESLRTKMQDAVDGCPRAALRIEED